MDIAALVSRLEAFLGDLERGLGIVTTISHDADQALVHISAHKDGQPIAEAQLPVPSQPPAPAAPAEPGEGAPRSAPDATPNEIARVEGQPPA